MYSKPFSRSYCGHGSSRKVTISYSSNSAFGNRPNFSEQSPDDFSTASYSECLKHLKDLAEKIKHNPEQKTVVGCATKPPSLEESKSQLLEWSKELDKNTKLPKSENSLEEHNKDPIKWAWELHFISKLLRLTAEDLNKIFNNEVKSSKLTPILPFLDFVVFCLKSVKSVDDLAQVWLPESQKLWRTGEPKILPFTVWEWIVSASAAVSFDPNSSHRLLEVSNDRSQVWVKSGFGSSVMEHPDRFDREHCILGDRGFTKGRHFWRVMVSPEGAWRMGVTSASAQRKGDVNMNPVCGYWTLQRSPLGLLANEHNSKKLQVADIPSLVGIFLDMEERQVSFYDAERGTHIYTFVFYQTERELKPVFSVMSETTVLTI